jgi:hypothetical protein
MGARTAYKVRDVLHPILGTTGSRAEPEGSRNRIVNGESNRFP